VVAPVSALSVNVAGGRFALAALLHEPSYRRLWASGLCMSVARWMDLVTLGWLSFQLTGSVEPSGRAADAGLRRGDVIQEVDGRKVDSVDALRSALQHGDRPALLLVHRQGRTLFLTLERNS